MRGARVGFGIGFLLTGDQKYVDTLRRQIDNMYAQKKVVDGKEMIPQKYGERGWYGYVYKSRTAGGNVNFRSLPELTDIYTWTLEPSDLPRISDAPWIHYMRGERPRFPLSAIADNLDTIRRQVQSVRADTKTRDTRGSSDMPVVTSVSSLMHLMLGANDPGSGGNVLHAQVRYFDSAARRPGLPRGAGALVEQVRSDGITLLLVNTNAVNSRELIVQTGAYAEHDAVAVIVNGQRTEVGDSMFAVRLGAGAGARLTIRMKRYANQPTFAFP